MPPRSPGQKLVNIPMNEDFIALINDAVERFNYGDRAKLIREAVTEKLERLGLKVPKELVATPPRIGKGGRRSTPLLKKKAS
jgi:hypothetical protein